MPSLQPSALLSFTTYVPLRRTFPYANRSESRRPPEDASDDARDDAPDRVARSSRPLSASNSNPQRHVNRRQNSQRRQPSPPLPQSAGDLFRFFEGEDGDDPDASQLAQQRSGRSGPRGRSTQRFSKSNEEDEITLEEDGNDDSELSDMDDTVDDGFFSRYRKEAGPGQRITDYSSLDANGEESSEETRKAKGSSKRMDRETAASAFDAVDKLFGSINVGKEGAAKKSVGRRRQKPGSGTGTEKVRSGQLDRAKWLADVKARASTKDDSVTLDGKDGEDRTAVDVSAVEDLSGDGEMAHGGDLPDRAMHDAFEEAEVGGDVKENDVAERKSGFSAHKGDVLFDESNGEQATPREGSSPASSLQNVSGEAESSEEAAFQKLMSVARQGPNAGVAGRRQTPRPPRQGRSSNPASRSVSSSKGKKTETRRVSRRSRDDERPSSTKPDISRLLGLTKQIVSSQTDKPREDGGDDYEEIDGEMEKSVVLRGDAVGRRGSIRQQKYTAVRRVGNRSFRIQSPPDEWKPLTEEDVSKVRSDGRSIGRNNGNSNSKGKGIVADCISCRGSGLDACTACLGSGWVPPLSDDGVGGRRGELLELIWNRPNLCVDRSGEAQCVMCNGIGKQFCGACKGSGSALKKGFSPSEKNEIFDMFPGDDDSLSEEDEYADDDEEEIEDAEDFQLYTGPEEPYDIQRKSSSLDEASDELGGNADDMGIAQVVGDDLEVGDESAELLATLEAMHLADLEEGGPEYMNRLRHRGVVHNDDDDDDDDDDVDVDVDVDDDFEMVIGDEEVGDVEEDEEVSRENLNIAGLDDDDDLDDELDDDNDDDDDIIDDLENTEVGLVDQSH